MDIPLSNPDITELEKKAIIEVLDSPNLSLGPRLGEFEKIFREYVGTRYAIAVNSGTSGLHLCLHSLGLGPDNKIITSPFSFIASANSILMVGAEPVFVDIDPFTLNICTNKLEDKLHLTKKNGDTINALLPIHIFGRPCPMDEILKISKHFDLPIIEDSCEALGAEYLIQGKESKSIFEDSFSKKIKSQKSETSSKSPNWRKVGGLGRCGVFGFYPNKQITTGEGGMIVTDDEQVNKLCRSLRNQGRDKEGVWLKHARLGFNYRLSDISCALGIAQLSRIDEILQKRKKVADCYHKHLAEIKELKIPKERAGEKISWFVYVIQLSKKFTREDRDSILQDLRLKGISCGDYFPPIHLQPLYRDMGYKRGDFPVTESVSDRTIALPFFNNLREDQIKYICFQLKEIISRY